MKRIFLLIIVSVLCSSANTQPFWNTTNSFPGGPKTGIALSQDSVLFVGLYDGIIQSHDGGNSFDTSLRCPVIFSLYATASGKVMAGGYGMIYLTNDLGVTWDSISLDPTFPVIRFIEDQTGGIFAITGMLSIELGFIGDGVLYSNDGGLSWENRNNGLGIYECCERIAIDSNDRLYLAMADEYVTGNGGLFISDDYGMNWEHITIRIDGQGVVPDDIKIANTFGLSVSADDSVYFSFTGTAINALVTLNTCKSIHDIQDNSYWKVYKVFNSVSWWLDRILGNIHFASDGTWYSSSKGSVNTGGTYYSLDKGLSWTYTDEGLGVDYTGNRKYQYFTENSDGKIFMVQIMDEQVYFTEKSPSSVKEPEIISSMVRLYPNPTRPGELITLEKAQPTGVSTCFIMDITGREISSFNFSGVSCKIKAPGQKGLYILKFGDNTSNQNTRFIVR